MRKNLINRLLEMEYLTPTVVATWKESIKKAKKDLNKPVKRNEILTPKAIHQHALSMHSDIKIRRANMIKYLNKMSDKKLLEYFENKVREEESDKYDDYRNY
jgi:hypothetical protein